eukprot:Em0023g927a
MASPFVPKGQEGLLVRNPISLNNGFFHTGTQELQKISSHKSLFNSASKKVAYYSRHNPHPERVFHIKGLLDSPICCVEDNVSPRMLLSPPSEGLRGEPYRPPGNTRYSANKLKSTPAVGIVPVTRAWRDELEAKAKNAIERVLGKVTHTQEPKEMLTSAVADVDDRKVLEWLCRILHTNSIAVCQEWLTAASEQEKAIVLNMIRMVADGDVEFTTPACPLTNDYWYKYSPTEKDIKPERLQPAANDVHVMTYQKNYGQQSNKEQDILSPAFKLPEHDTVIRSGSQLSKLTSRDSSRRTSRAQSADIADLAKLIPSSKKHIAHFRSQSARPELQSHMLPQVFITKHRQPLHSGTQRLAYTMHNNDQ